MTNKEEVGPYSIGSTKLPGLSKITEEVGGLLQTIGKLLGNNGRAKHWSRSNLMTNLMEEIADVYAALDFYTQTNMSQGARDVVMNRRSDKLTKFKNWHSNPQG